jgi:shikimate kinase
VEEIYERAMKDGKDKRPVIDKKDPKSEIKEVLDFRKPFYKAAAEYTIDTEGRKVEKIAEEIIKKTEIKKGKK